ncbi:MAG TPA: hypothetical protein ENO22_02805 [candidate division Zixibacteria bacterium]|nr:hypothetical protein [candidate division Zixibacteria bacterium]
MTTQSLRMWGIVPLSLLLCLGIIMLACGGDSPAGPDDMADMNTYMSSLPAWDEFCPPVIDSDAPTGETVENLDMGQGLFCHTTPCSITETPEQVVTYGTFSNILWLGGLIQGDTYAGGLGSMEELPIRQRAPLTVGVNLLHGDSVSTVVQDPDAASVGQATSNLIAIAMNSGFQAGSSVYFTQKEMYSLEQAMLSLGLSANYMGTEVRNKLDLTAVKKKNTLTAYFKQFMFETYIVQPQTPSEFFSAEFTPERLEEQVNTGSIGPDNLPVYVSRIQWGRIMLLTMSSDSSYTDMKNALKATHPAFSIDLTAKYEHILSTSEMEVVTFGGDDADALGLIRSGNIESYFTQSPDLSTAFPIAYALNNLADNSPAKVGETTEYEVKECTQITTAYYTDWNQWRDAFSVIQDSSDNKFFETNAENIYKSDEVDWIPGSNSHLVTNILTFAPANTGYDFTFYLKTLQDGCPYPLTFNDSEFSGATNLLSIGDVDNCQYDAFEIGVSNFLNDSYVFAVGIYVGDNGVSSDEKLEIFYHDRKIEEIPYSQMPSGGLSFMGIVSTIPITKIKFTEGYDGDDIYVKDFCFGVAYRR